jgi:DNA-binding FadR family transcriptional regulator
MHKDVEQVLGRVRGDGRERARVTASSQAAAPVGFRMGSDKAVSSHDQVARMLGTDIVSGRYPPGGNLPGEAELLARFQVSRTVLREALKTLSAKGLISSKTRVGTRVSDPVHWNLFDATVLSWRVSLGLDEHFRRELFEVRRLLEPRAAELAAMRRDPDSIAAMRRHLARMRDEGQDARLFAEADLDLHLAVGEASGNSLMRSIAGVIEAALIASFTLSSPKSAEAHAESVRRHTAIVDAIEAGDPVAASRAMLLVIDEASFRLEGPGATVARDTHRPSSET